MINSKLSLGLLMVSLIACSSSEPAKIEKKGDRVFTKSNPDGIAIDANPRRTISHNEYKKTISKEDGFFVTKEYRERQTQTEEDGYLKSVQEHNKSSTQPLEADSKDKAKLKPLTKEEIHDDGTTTIEEPEQAPAIKDRTEDIESQQSGNNKEVRDLTELAVAQEYHSGSKGFKLKTPRGSNKLKWPIEGEVIARFGKNGNKSNDGINIAAPAHTPVKAAGDGKVIYVGNGVEGYGNLVIIKHDNDVMTAYSHLEDIKVKRGEIIKMGDKIGSVGQSGNVSTPQLHFSVRNGKKTVDPESVAK